MQLLGHLPEEPLQDPQMTAQRVQALVGHQYCSPQDTVFYIEGQTLSWSDRNLTILDDHGNLAFTMENKAWRLRGNKILKDIEGRSVGFLREKVSSSTN